MEPILKDDEYLVADDGILDMTMESGNVRCQVKWEGYKDPGWQPLENMLNPEVVKCLVKNGWKLVLDKKNKSKQ